MKSRLVLFLSFFLIACNLPFTVAPATATPKPTIPPNTPGMLVRGHVTVNDKGLAHVSNYKRFSAYPRELIATTDENGYYESSFIYIPGDEMVSIEAELPGYSFDPPFYYWRHYHGYVEYAKDFSATATP